jgi:hypothetical protein
MVSSPKPPDPYATAQAQGSANMTAAQQNSVMGNVNERNPYGSVSYNTLGYEPIYDSQGKVSYAPRYERNVQLSPDQMKLLGLQTQAQYNMGNTAVQQSAKIGSLLNTNLTTAGMQPWQMAAAPGAVRQDQGPTDRAAIEKSIMDSYHRTADPQNAAQQAQLAARGLSPGSQGYGTVQQGQLDAESEAARQGYLASGQESRAAQDAYKKATQQRYTMGSDWASQANNLRQAQLQEQISLRNQPINEISALLSNSQVTVPEFQPFARSQTSAAPLGQYIGDNYNIRAQQAANTNSGIFGLGSALLTAPMTGGTSLAGNMFSRLT